MATLCPVLFLGNDILCKTRLFALKVVLWEVEIEALDAYQ